MSIPGEHMAHHCFSSAYTIVGSPHTQAGPCTAVIYHQSVGGCIVTERRHCTVCESRRVGEGTESEDRVCQFVQEC